METRGKLAKKSRAAKSYFACIWHHGEGRHGLRLKVSAFISDDIRPLYVLDDRLLSVTGKICLGGRLGVSEISLSGQAVAAASYEDAFVSRKADR